MRIINKERSDPNQNLKQLAEDLENNEDVDVEELIEKVGSLEE
jgi:hypothetical protein